MWKRFAIPLAVVAIVGCPSSKNPGGSKGTAPAAFGVSITSPTEGTLLGPKFQVALACSYDATKPATLTLSISGGPTQTLVAASTVTATVDASALPPGLTLIAATLTQGTEHVVATRQVFVSLTALIPTFQTPSGFYKMAEPVALSVTFAEDAPVAQVSFATQAGAALGTVQSPTAGLWTLTLPASQLGRGHVTVTATATDSAGNTGTASLGPLSVGLLDDTDCETCGGQLQLDVVTPAGEGLLYAALLDTSAAGAVDAKTSLGELRFTGFGGGSTTTIATRVCFRTDAQGFTGEGSDVILSADGSRVLFRTAPVTSTGTAPVCSELVSSALLPGTGDPQILDPLLTAGLDSSNDLLSTDGSVVVWTEDEKSYWGGTLVGMAPTTAKLSTTAKPVAPGAAPVWLPLHGALLLRSPADGSLSVLNQAGFAAIDDGMTPLLTKALPDYWIAAGFPTADGTAALVRTTAGAIDAVAPTGTVVHVCVPPDCSPGTWTESAPAIVSLQTSLIAFSALDSTGNPQVAVYDASRQGVHLFPDAAFVASGPVRPRDGSTVPVQVPAASGTAGKVDVMALDGTSLHPLATDLDATQVSTFFLNPGASWWRSSSPLVSRNFFGIADDPQHCLVFDDTALLESALDVPGSPLAPSASPPFAGAPGDDGPIVLLPDGQTAVFQTGVRDLGANPIAAPGAGPLWVTKQWGPAVQLQPTGGATTDVLLPLGDDSHWLISAGPAADMRGADHVAFAQATGVPDQYRLYVGATDDTGVRLVTMEDDSDDVSAERRFGVTSDDSTVWWYSVTGHLFAQPIAGGTNVDLGALEPQGIVSLTGDVFFATQLSGSLHQMIWTSLSEPTIHLLGAPMSGNPWETVSTSFGEAATDDQASLYVVNQFPAASGKPQPVFLVNSMGAMQLAANEAQFILDYDAGFGFSRDTTGALYLLDQHATGTATLLESGATDAPVRSAGEGTAGRTAAAGRNPTTLGASIPGHPQPSSVGELPWGGLGGGDTGMELGARGRFTISYALGGTTRPGIYVYDTVTATTSGQN